MQVHCVQMITGATFVPSLLLAYLSLSVGFCVAQNDKPSVVVQGYKIVVEDVQRTDVMKMETELNPLRGLKGQDMEQFMKALQLAINGGIPNADKDQIPPPNIGIALLIQSGTKNRPKNNSLVEFASPFTATDEKGERLESPDNPSLDIHFPQFEKDKKESHFIYFYQKQRNAEKIATLKGELSMTPGRVVSVEFKGPKFANQTKRMGRDSFTITSFEQNKNETIVTMSLPNLQKNMPDFNNPQAFQAAMLDSLQAYRLEAEDDKGQIYKPRQMIPNGGSSMAQMSSNFSFQFGEGFNNQAANGQKPQNVQTQVFNLTPIPQDRQLKAIRITMIDKTGDSRKIPFVIRDIALP